MVVGPRPLKGAPSVPFDAVPSPEDPADDDGFVPPLPPEDRLWRHPSEMAAHGPTPGFAAPPDPRSGSGTRARTAGIVVASAAAGMLLTVVTLAAVGVLEGHARRVVVEQVAVDDPGDDVPLSESVGPAIARLQVHTADGERSASALVYRSDGHLLTSSAAIEGAEQVSVVLADGRALEGRVVGADQISGVAVVAVEATDLVTAVLGADADAIVGDTALAISHGPGTGASPAISLTRVTGTGWWVRDTDRTHHGMIRTSLGGPVREGAVLCNQGGSVVGLLQTFTARSDASGDTEDPPLASTSSVATTEVSDSRYAVPIHYAVRIADELVLEGRVRHPWMGVDGEDLDATGAAEIGRTGVRLTAVAADGPAAAAGLVEGDVVLSVDTTPVGSFTAMVVALRDHVPGDVVALRYSRDGSTRSAMVTLGEKA
jgi:S1-C subfamily serine protease